MVSKAPFDLAAQLVRDNAAEMAKRTDAERLQIYGLFKQATVGDINIPKPGMFQLEAKAKFEAWESQKGTTKDAAMAAYVKVAKQLLPPAAAAKLP